MREIYHRGYLAKRMEIGAVVGAAPAAQVVRERPAPGDVVVLLGGRTGRDGIGGATGSSKQHTEASLATSGAEVQKGNAPTERKIQRLFRDPAVSRMIKRCNDFGAGGVAVAIGELADGLMIDLDAVPKKYEGLDGTELAISESQERMAVVLAPGDVAAFLKYADAENLEATRVAVVTSEPYLVMKWRGKEIVRIARSFLATNGVRQRVRAVVETPNEKNPYLQQIPAVVKRAGRDLEKAWLSNLRDLNICSQKGLGERFDASIGAASVLMPFGGKYQLTPAEAMVAKIPVRTGETNTASAMSFGFDPDLSTWSPFHGAVYAIVEAAAKIVATGGDPARIRLTLQEYFEHLGTDPKKWGKPFAALLGALYAQHAMGMPAIGGKDSMSGSFEDLSVPPTLVAFAVAPVRADEVISPEFKFPANRVVMIPVPRDAQDLPVFPRLNKNFEKIYQLIAGQKAFSAQTVGKGGIAAELRKSQILMLPGGFSGGDEPGGSGKFIAAMFRAPEIAEAMHRLLRDQDGLILGICNGFQALLKLGLLPHGKICDLDENAPTLTYNNIGRHVSQTVRVRVASNLSPWLTNVNVGDAHTIAVSHGEGRFYADAKTVANLRVRGQIATQYVNDQGDPTLEQPYNPNGSVNAIEGITSPDGRIYGRMAHAERIGENIGKNVVGDMNQQVFESGAAYFMR